MGIDKYNEHCRSIVMRYAGVGCSQTVPVLRVVSAPSILLPSLFVTLFASACMPLLAWTRVLVSPRCRPLVASVFVLSPMSEYEAHSLSCV